jgi:transcriptional regulator with XRE-family HTH domain
MNFIILLNMGFKENLKAELLYADMRVKELARLSGVKKQTIDSYLRENSYTPSVEAAAKIAGALGVSVEYLVMGKDMDNGRATSLNPDARLLIQSLGQLNEADRKVVIRNALFLIESMRSRIIK